MTDWPTLTNGGMLLVVLLLVALLVATALPIDGGER